MFLIRTKSGQELLARGFSARPDSEGFCLLTGVYRLKYVPSSNQAIAVSMVFRKGETKTYRLAKDSIEGVTPDVEFDLPKT